MRFFFMSCAFLFLKWCHDEFKSCANDFSSEISILYLHERKFNRDYHDKMINKYQFLSLSGRFWKRHSKNLFLQKF